MHIGHVAAREPDRAAYIMAESGRVVTYGELNRRSIMGSRALRTLGVRAGDHVAILMENHEEFFVVCWAAQRSGLYYTAISHRLLPDEIAYIVRDCGAKAVITSPAQAATAAAVRARCDASVAWLVVERCAGAARATPVDGATDGFLSWNDALAAEPTEPLDDETEGVDMLYSSGTTGKPKGISLPLKGEPFGTLPAVYKLVEALYMREGEMRYLSTAPLYHAAPLRYNMVFHRRGSTCVVMESFDAERALALIERHRITHSQWVPTMFVKLLKLPPEVRAKYDVSSMQVAVHAAAPCPVEVKKQMLAWWGPTIYEYYSGTEGNGFTAISPEEWLANPGSVGRAMLGEPHILDDDGNELPVGQAGVVWFANGLPFAYHDDPEKTAASVNDRGWSTLGDIGYLNEAGYLFLTDRKAYTIISGGVNIYPQEVEDLLVVHPKVADVAVFGVPDEELGEVVKAVVQPAPGVAPTSELAEELLAYCRARIAKFKCPRSVDFEAELPRHPTGKLYKRLLRDRYWPARATG